MYTLAVQSLRAERRLVDDDVTAYSNTCFFCQRAGGDHISHVNLGACTIHGSSRYISKLAPGPLKTCWRSLFWLFQGYQPNHRRTDEECKVGPFDHGNTWS